MRLGAVAHRCKRHLVELTVRHKHDDAIAVAGCSVEGAHDRLDEPVKKALKSLEEHLIGVAGRYHVLG
jgi:hypothetical protein